MAFRIPLFTGPAETADMKDFLNQLIVLMNTGILVPAGLQLYFREKIVQLPGQAVIEVPYTQYGVKLLAPQALSFQLPDVEQWLDTYNNALPLLIMDYAGAASPTDYIEALAFAGQTIDGLASWRIEAPYGTLALRPRGDGVGWKVT